MATAQLKQELRMPSDSLSEAYRLAYSTLELLDCDYISEEKAHSRAYAEYKFFTADVRTEGPFGTDSEEVISRPVNDDVFIQDTETFADKYDEFESLLHDFDVDEIAQPTRQLIRTVTYSLTISIGIAMDFLLDQQGARKNSGERFDDTIISIFEELAVVNSAEIKPFDQNQLDIIISPHGEVRSSEDSIDPDEVVSIKTTSKDRFKNIYSDKSSLEATVGGEVDWIAIFLYDVQRQSRESMDYSIAKTFMPGRFEDFQSDDPLDGIYYIDPPRGYRDTEYGAIVGDFDQFVCKDLWDLL